jgi:2-polyprenyl-3-methyl-5-hydroxy-6-metoxy-1,4-benzoquinol methylase
MFPREPPQYVQEYAGDGLARGHPVAAAVCYVSEHRISGWYPQFELLSNANPVERQRLFEAAAKILRQRVTFDSRFHALLEGIPDDSLPPFFALPFTERLSRMAEPGQPQIGDMPPQPPTLRGRVGAVLVNIVRRMLFWYTDQIRAQHKRIAEAAREQARALHELSAAGRWGRDALADITSRVAGQEQQQVLHASRLEDIWTELQALAGRIERIELQVDPLLSGQSTIARALSEHAAAVRIQTESLLERLTDVEREAREESDRIRAGLGARMGRFEASLQELHAPPTLSRKISHVDDRLLAAHAQAFRGDRAEIKRRLAVYLPHAQRAYAAAGSLPALDLGCGRGEWLEVLSESGIPVRGIDANREFVAACRELGLNATEGDLPQVLQSIPDESHGIVSAIHVLEHLSFRDLLEVVDQAVRILKPGGIVVFETPNPRNLFVSSNNFYLDPTHHHPLPSEFLAFIVEARGLSQPQVLPLVPYPDSYRLQETGQAALFINEHFFGPQDYGIIARKS